MGWPCWGCLRPSACKATTSRSAACDNNNEAAPSWALSWGLRVGLGAAFAVAVCVSKIPVPFPTRDGDKTASPRMPQADWNPNTALGGKVTPPPVAPVEVKPEGVAPTETPAAQATASNDPLGDLAKAQIAKAEAAEKAKAAASDGFVYFVQVGAFRSQADADAQRAKLGLIGQQARVSEREQNGRPVYRVRIGPMAQRSEAEALKQQLGDTGIDAALVRIHQ